MQDKKIFFETVTDFHEWSFTNKLHNFFCEICFHPIISQFKITTRKVLQTPGSLWLPIANSILQR